jgi:hypothetical protein
VSGLARQRKRIWLPFPRAASSSAMNAARGTAHAMSGWGRSPRRPFMGLPVPSFSRPLRRASAMPRRSSIRHQRWGVCLQPASQLRGHSCPNGGVIPRLLGDPRPPHRLAGHRRLHKSSSIPNRRGSRSHRLCRVREVDRTAAAPTALVTSLSQGWWPAARSHGRFWTRSPADKPRPRTGTVALSHRGNGQPR